MSTIVAQTLSNGTVSTSTANCIQGSAKAWVNFAGASGTVNASYNVSSVTRRGTGLYTVNFTNAMPNANYAVAGYTRNSGGTGLNYIGSTTSSSTASTTSLQMEVGFDSNRYDNLYATVAIFST